MFFWKIRTAVVCGALIVAMSAASVVPARPQSRDRIRIPVGRADVVNSPDDVRTVVIAEPKIADAAVGSARTVVVNARSPGITTLVVYTEGARYRVYDVEVFVPHDDKQVLLRVRVAEVNDKAARELGFDWYGQGTNNSPWIDGFVKGGLLTSKISPLAVDPETRRIGGLSAGPLTDGFLAYEKNNSDLVLQATWKALEDKGDLRTLATPTLVARSGQEASFLAGGELPIPVASAGQGGVNTITIQWKEFGVRLNFTPTVEENNTITLKVAPELSQLDFSNALALSGFLVPSLLSRKASTTVNLRPGEHLAIGGLKQTDRVRNVRRVPILGHIPLLGFFFTNTRTENVERDLLVVVSPEIVEQAESTLPRLPTDRQAP
jgi:pilus assembly protein CpaC